MWGQRQSKQFVFRVFLGGRSRRCREKLKIRLWLVRSRDSELLLPLDFLDKRTELNRQ
jgi:hypothetical protein